MSKRESINNILKLLAEEAKKLKKKKKKFSPVAIGPITRPMGSIFSMDAAVSMGENLNEGYGQKPVTKKFDHLKWQLNEFQKHFLDDFINIPDEALADKDFEYASKRTGIPLQSLKSIRNTYGTPELGYAKPDVTIGSMFDAGHKGPTAKEMGLGNVPITKHATKTIQPNQNPEFRNKSLGQIRYEKEMSGLGGKLKRSADRELPEFMYEWLMFFIEGSEKTKIKESKILNSAFSQKGDKNKYVLFSIDIPLKENNLSAVDLASSRNLLELKEFEESIIEFNKTFGTNFVIEHQFTGDDGFLKVVLENAQTTDGQKIFNKKKIDMTMTDEKRASLFNSMKSMYG